MKKRTLFLTIVIVISIVTSSCTIADIGKNILGSKNVPEEPKPGTVTEEEQTNKEEQIEIIEDTNKYTDVEGVLTFRGNNYRTAPAYGNVEIKENAFEKLWEYKTSGGKGIWGGGSGWTGQPALVKWSKDVRIIMNIKEKFKQDDDFVEVIIGSLNGKVYFLDLKTGEPTREPIDTGDPLKGSVSVDARGYPLLYVGQGIKESNELGFYIYNLIDQKPLFFQNGSDAKALRRWPAFDSSALFDKNTDELFVGGENGIVYKLKLNTKFSLEEKIIKINPQIEKYVYSKKDKSTKPINSSLGIESSLGRYENLLFFSDNGGTIKCMDTDLKEVWTIHNLDDTDSTITVDVEDGVPYLYTGNEVDKQGEKGISRFIKINGKTGEIVWENKYPCFSRFGESPSNGGMLGTSIVGKNDISDLVIISLCRYGKFDGGALLALDKKTGKQVWKHDLSIYSWGSPVDVYDKDGKSYIIQCERNGMIRLIEGRTGTLLGKMNQDSYVEASPSVFNNYMVYASRTGKIYGMKLK